MNIVDFLSYSVIAICFVVKIPQIVKILQAGTSQGLNLNSVMLEFWCFNSYLSYSVANSYPVKSYGDFIVLSIQSFCLLLLILYDRGMIDMVNLSLLFVLVSYFVSVAMGLVPENLMYIMMSTTGPCSAMSKVLQIYTIWRDRDAGTVSASTWGMAVYTSTARIFTHYFTTGDKFLMAISIQAAILNLILVLSVIKFS